MSLMSCPKCGSFDITPMKMSGTDAVAMICDNCWHIVDTKLLSSQVRYDVPMDISELDLCIEGLKTYVNNCLQLDMTEDPKYTDTLKLIRKLKTIRERYARTIQGV